jgi:CheY-like chemotaxis protein
MSRASRPPLPSQPPPRSVATDFGERIKRSLPPELCDELEAVGIDPSEPPNAAQWFDLLPRLAGLIRARSFGRDSVSLSHELRTPMTVVIGATELLLESTLDDDQRAVVEGVHNSGQQLLSILNQVLDGPRDSGRSVQPSDFSKPATRLDGRALVVEDNDFNQRLISHTLSGIGCQVESVSNGMDALAKLGLSDYDVILMDCHMPGLDGFDTAREIRRLERGKQRVPIIAVTAGGVGETRSACLAAGMDDYVAKPFSLATLRARVAYWISRRRDSEPVPLAAPLTVPVPSQETATHLDLSRLEELATEEGSAQIALELSGIFLEDIVRRLVAFSDAARTRDLTACLGLAHAIKGACGNFGAVGMARLAEESERRCRAGALDQIFPLAVKLGEELALVRAILDEHGLIAVPGVTPRPRLGPHNK